MGLWKFQPNLNTTESTLGDQIEYQHWEQAELSGYPCKFIKAVEVESNEIFSESTARSFISANGHSMNYDADEDSFLNGVESFGGFGYTPTYSQIFYVPVKYFKDLTLIPLEGDLFYEETDNILYEIVKVGTKTETQQSIRINDRMFSYKIYLKQYQFSYKDSFDATLESEIFTAETNLEQLDALNATLQTNVTNLNIVDDTDEDSIFGDLK